MTTSPSSNRQQHPSITLPRGTRSAFTLVELLVVIAIIGILMSMVLPAIQSSREAGRRVQCMNNVRQIALGLQNYHSTNRRFPVGQVVRIDEHRWTRWSWFYELLAFTEEKTLSERYLQHARGPVNGGFSYTNMPDKNAILPMYLCPSGGEDPKTPNGSSIGNQQGFHGNYVLNGGNTYFNAGGVAASQQLNGLFMADTPTSITVIRDGASKTLMVSEILIVPDGAIGSGSEDIRGRYHNVRHAGALFSTMYTPNPPIPDRHNYCISTSDAPCIYTGTDVIVSARSRHSTGVAAAMADAAVTFIPNDVDQTVFNALGSRSGGETVGSL